jgi:hypothetical protein
MRRPGGLAICLLLTLSAAMPATAAADWTEPRPVTSENAHFSFTPPLAVNERGDVAIAWVARRGQVRVALRRAGASKFSKPVTVPGSRRAADPLVAINRHGEVAVGWRAGDPANCSSCSLMTVSVRRAGGRFGRAQVVSLPGESIDWPAVAIGPGGTAGAAWNGGGVVQAAFARRGGRFGGPVQIGRYEPGFYTELTFDGRDRATAFWRMGERQLERLRYARRDPNGTLTAPRTAAAPGADPIGFEFTDYVAGTDGAGRHLLAWTTNPDHAEARIEVAASDRGGRFGPRRQLAVAEPENFGNVFRPHLAVAPNGAAAVAWLRGNPSPTYAEFALRRTPGGPFEVRKIPGSEPAYNVRVAVAGSGRSAVAWEAFSGIRATVGDGAGNLAEPRAFAAHGGRPAVGIDRRGNAIVVWLSGGLVFSEFRRDS